MGQLMVAWVLWRMVATIMASQEPIASGCSWGQQQELCTRLQAAAMGGRLAVHRDHRCHDGLPGKILGLLG